MKFFNGKVLPKSSTTISARFNQEVQRRNSKAFSDLVVVGCSVISLILVAALFNKVSQLESRRTPTLVQKDDGSVIDVEVYDSDFRSNEVLKKFVTDALILLMSWSREPAKGQSESLNNSNSNTKNKPPSYEEQSTTIQNDENKSIIIPTSVFYGSFAFTEAGGFRDVLMKSQIANMIGKTKVMEGQEKTALSIRTVGTPEFLEIGKWKITIVSDFMRWDMKGANIERIAFNKDVYVQVVAQPSGPRGKPPNALEIILKTIRRSRLEIYDMQDIGIAIPKRSPAGVASPPSPSPGAVSPSPVATSPSPSASVSPQTNVFSNKEFIKK
jgi:hypothetical protein